MKILINRSFKNAISKTWKCLLAVTCFPTNSLFFRTYKATCKIGLLMFHETLIFSPRLPFSFYVPLSLRWTVWILCYVTILLLLRQHRGLNGGPVFLILLFLTVTTYTVPLHSVVVLSGVQKQQ